MPEENKDDKPVVDPSPTQDDKLKTDGTPSAPVEPKPIQTEESLADVVSKAASESLAREAAEESAALELSRTKEEKPVVEPEVPTADKSTETKVDEEVPKEFNEHPAWKRIIGERNEARETIAKLEATVKEASSLTQYCRERNISTEQFQQAMDVVSLLNTDPTKAYERLQPIIAQLETHMGLRLPEDLEKKVKEGLLDPETAAEVAKLRSEKTFAEQRRQAETVSAQQANIAAMVKGLNEWDTNKRTGDPDFESKAELVRGMFLSLYQAQDAQGRQVNPVRTPQDAVALAERAYTLVNERIGKFVPRRPTKPALTSQGASTKVNNKPPKSTKEAVAAMLREKHGISLEDEE